MLDENHAAAGLARQLLSIFLCALRAREKRIAHGNGSLAAVEARKTDQMKPCQHGKKRRDRSHYADKAQ